jgi:crotonobetainyl-CoA:carnitine CoA-transferase CaiB-like acyl-CoA transferase
MFAAYGMLSALFFVQRTGKGQFVDVSLLDGQVVLLNHLALHHSDDWVLSA